MKRIAWLTDVHLNFVSRDDVNRFLLHVAKQQSDCIVLTGDIAEAPDVCRFLREMAEAWQQPIYFVLGNHDYYFSSIQAVRAEVSALAGEVEDLHFLTDGELIGLTSDVGLIGHDGWADARYGDYLRSYVTLYDYRLIKDLAGQDKLTRGETLHRLGDEATNATRPRLIEALTTFDHVYLITHVPPLLEACWHEGQISDANWSPHFTCKAMGDMLLEVMREHGEKQLTVLCGHTHGSGETRPLANLLIRTGGAVYGKPGIVDLIEL